MAAVRRKGSGSDAGQRKNLNNLRDGLPFPYTGQDASEYIAPMLSANENDAFAYAITISDRANGSIAVSSLKPPTFSAFILSLSHATEAPGEHWRKPDACFGHLRRLHAENRHPDATAMLKDLIYVQETEYCPEDQCDFAIQEDYRLYDNSTAGTLIIGMLYVSPVFVCIALAILSFKTLSTLDHERRYFAVLYSLRADARMQRAALLRQTGAFFSDAICTAAPL